MSEGGRTMSPFSGRWFRLGKTFHAEQYRQSATLCGRKLAREAAPVALVASGDICDGCWTAANR